MLKFPFRTDMFRSCFLYKACQLGFNGMCLLSVSVELFVFMGQSIFDIFKMSPRWM